MHAKLILWVALLASCSTSATIAAEPADAEYYPLVVGDQWRYQFESGDRTSTLTSRVGKEEQIDGMTMARIDAEVDGQLVATEHLRVTDEGVFRCRYNGSELTPPVCILRFPIKDGESWESECHVGQEKFHIHSTVSHEEVEVPQGRYDAVKVVVTTKQAGKAISSTYWFAPGVGNVKQVMNFSGKETPFELIDFKSAK